MPATLGHIGLQYLATKGLYRKAGTKWILLGCIIPDLPWILQRFTKAIGVFSPYDIRLYAVAQSSLAICLLLCAACAPFSRQPRLTFLILALGCLLHLGLDALQVKWASGVLLFAPFDWGAIQLGYFWPEAPLNLLILLLGIIVCLWIIYVDKSTCEKRKPMGLAKQVLAAGGFAAYLVMPVTMISDVYENDLHFIATLREQDARPGKLIEIDRNRVSVTADSSTLHSWSGETLSLSGAVPDRNTILSIKGSFATTSEIVVTAYYVHGSQPWRDYASYFGLGFIAFFWLRTLFFRQGKQNLL